MFYLECKAEQKPILFIVTTDTVMILLNVLNVQYLFIILTFLKKKKTLSWSRESWLRFPNIIILDVGENTNVYNTCTVTSDVDSIVHTLYDGLCFI